MRFVTRLAATAAFFFTGLHLLTLDFLAASGQLTGSLFLPLSFRVFFSNSVFFLALALVLLAKSARERYLSMIYLVVSASFIDSTLLKHLHNMTNPYLSLLIERIPIDAATPLVVWMFFREFPKSGHNFKQNWIFNIGVKTSGYICLLLATLYIFGLQHHLPLFDRADRSSLYWGLIFGFAFASIPPFIFKVNKTLTEERYRVKLFGAATVLCMAPVFLFILMTLKVEYRTWVLSDSVLPWATSFNAFFLMLSIGVSAYTIFASDVLELRRVVHAAYRSIIANSIVGTITFSPLILFIGYLGENIDQSLVTVLQSIPSSLLIFGSAFQLALLFAKKFITDKIQQTFFGYQRSPQWLMLKTTQLLGVETKEQLQHKSTEILVKELKVPRACLLIKNQDELFFDSSGEINPAPPSLLQNTFIADTSSVQWLNALDNRINEESKNWLAKNRFNRLIVLRHAGNDEPIGLLAIGQLSNQREYNEDLKKWIGNIAHICEYRLTHLVNFDTQHRSAPNSYVNDPTDYAGFCMSCNSVMSQLSPKCVFCEHQVEAASLPALITNRYRLQRLLGIGAEGNVFLATDIFLDRQVAIKSLKQNHNVAPARLMREARVAASNSHPNLAQIYGADYYGTTPYLILEHMREGTLREKIDEFPLTNIQIDQMLEQIGDALIYLHNKGYVHGDLKPENIGYLSNTEMKLLDFGISRLLGTSNFGKPNSLVELNFGTTAYLSPAAIRGVLTDHRNDLWSLGVTAYEAATGVNPFKHDTAQRTKRAILRMSLKPPESINPAIDANTSSRIMKLLDYSNLPTIPGSPIA